VSRAVTKGATGKAGNRAAKTLRITQSEDNRLNEYGGYWAYGCRNLGINQNLLAGPASLLSFKLPGVSSNEQPEATHNKVQ